MVWKLSKKSGVASHKNFDLCLEVPARVLREIEEECGALEECRADSSSTQSLAVIVNYYASTTKASQAAETAQHEQMAWDWLSNPRKKQP